MFLKFFYLIHFLLIVFIIFFILLEQGKGANAGMTFGDHFLTKAQTTMLGNKKSNTFFFKLIFLLIFIFFSSNLILNKLIYKENSTLIVQNDPVIQNNITKNENIENDKKKDIHLPAIPR